MTANEQPPAKERAEPESTSAPPGTPMPETLLQKSVSFLNTSLGLTLVGFLLTSVIGGFLTMKLTAYDQKRQEQQHSNDIQLEMQQHKDDLVREQKAADNRQNADRAGEIRKLVAGAILRRLGYSELMIQIYRRKTTSQEQQDTWSNYWQTYRDYFLFRTENEMPADHGIGSDATVLDEKPILWTYLDSVIDPEFEKIHGCIVTAQGVYDPKSAGSSDKSSQVFNRCIIPIGQDNVFWAHKRSHSRAADPWASFKTCVGTFVLQFEYQLQFRVQLAAEDQRPSDTPHNLKKCPADYNGDAVCRELEFNNDLMKDMQEDCGPLPPDAQKELETAN